MKIPYKHLQTFDHHHLGVLAEMKEIYVSSMWHDYNPTKAAKKLGWSRNKVVHHMDYFKAQGLVIMQGKHLVFRNITKVIKERYGINHKHLLKFKSLQELRIKIVANLVKQKEFQKNKFKELSIPKNLKSFKSAKRRFKKVASNKFNEGIFLSYIGSKLSLSQSQSCRIMNQLVLNGFFSKKKQRHCFGSFNPFHLSILRENHNGVYVSGGMMYRNDSNIFLLGNNNIA